MEKMEYIRCINNNYLRIACGDSVPENKYAFKILEDNSLKHLLSMDKRMIDGEEYLYYLITSKQSIPNLFTRRSIDAEWQTLFMEAVENMLRVLEEYLLNSDSLILSPECIFQDMNTNSFYFLYHPYSPTGEAVGMTELVMYMIEHLDCDDKELVKRNYDLYERISVSGRTVSLQEFIHAWKASAGKPEAAKVEKEGEAAENPLADSSEPQRESKVIKEEFFFTDKSGGNPQKPGLRNWIERWRNNNRERRREREEYQKQIKSAMEGYFPEDIREERQMTESVGQGDINRTAEKNEDMEEQYGKTVYLEENECAEERKLYGVGRFNKRIIEIQPQSFIIGKKKDSVDYVLNDAAISRLHVRFTEHGGSLYMEDLNSTNGTFKNGFRLAPYERVSVQREDEIRLGKMEFTYR